MIVFAMVLNYFSGFGQSFFVGLILPHLKELTLLPDSSMGIVYSIATLVGSFVLPRLGRYLDKSSLKKYSLITILGFSATLMALGHVSGLVTMFFGFFFLRGFGQVNLSLISNTTMGKLFGRHRGKAISLGVLGFSFAEGSIPKIITFLTSRYSLSESLFYISISILFIGLLVVFFLIPKIPKTPFYEELLSSDTSEENNSWDWSYVIFKRTQVFVLMILNATLPFLLTGLFFQQAAISAFKGWSAELVANSFIIFSFFQIISSLIWGNVIDKLGPRYLWPFALIPAFISLISIQVINESWGIYIYMGFFGPSLACSSLLRATFWADKFGIQNLGRIKAMDSMILVFGTSAAPLIFTQLFDRGVTVLELLNYLTYLCLFAILGYMIMTYIFYRDSKKVS
jgi:MFS family permease